MGEFSIIGALLFIINGYATYMGLRDFSYLQHYNFHVDSILRKKQYQRLLTSGFLHANWLHFIFNMVALMAFSFQIETNLGYAQYLIIYFGSLIGGNLLALWIHRNHGDYQAVGASGAISGLIFSYILMFPDSSIGFILLPPELSFKSWIFGILFVFISIWGIKKQADNIGHEAHIGGAIIGVLITIAFKPSIVISHWWLVLAILGPFLAFMILVIRNPAILMIEDYWGEKPNLTSRKKKVNLKTSRPKMSVPKGNIIKPKPVQQKSKTEELNDLLDKINKVGLENLSAKERRRLDELSK